MQLLGAISLLLCVISMVAVILSAEPASMISFAAALLLMGASLTCLVPEIWCSGGALEIILKHVGKDRSLHPSPISAS